MINIIKSFDPPLNKHTVWIDLSTTPFSIKIHRNGDWEDANISENIIQYLSTGLKILLQSLDRLQLKVERVDRDVPKATSELTNDGEGGESGKFITNSDFEELFNTAFSEKFQSSTENLVSDANYTHTDNNFSNAYKNTLDTLETIITNGIRQYIIEHPEEFPEIDVDDELDATSENPVLNKVITENLNNLSLSLEEHTTNGGIHMPSGGLPGQILSVGADGSCTWIDLDYLDLVSYGVEWTAGSSSPDCTRIGNPTFHRTLPIQSRLRGCIALKGRVMYYLNEDNWAYKEDGVTPSKLDGTDGTVRVDTGGKFYIKSFVLGDKRQVRISTIKVDSTWYEVPRMLIDAYGATVVNNPSIAEEDYLSTLPIDFINGEWYHPYVSIVNSTANCRGGQYTNPATDQYLYTDPYRCWLNKPLGGIPITDARLCANLADAHLLTYDLYKWIFVWLPVIEYATFNLLKPFEPQLTEEGYHQGGLGGGMIALFPSSSALVAYNQYQLCPNGITNEFGNHSGCKEGSFTRIDDTVVEFTIPRYRGFEDIFGDVGTTLEGILALYDDSEVDALGNCKYIKFYTCDNPQYYDVVPNEHYTLKARVPMFYGLIKEFILGDAADILPLEAISTSEVGSGWSSKYKSDSVYSYVSSTNRTSTEIKRVELGNNAYNGGGNGILNLNCYAPINKSSSNRIYRTVNIYQE